MKAAVKRRARCHGPSCKVDIMRSHCLSAPNKSAFESRVRSILPAPDLSDFDSTAKYGMSPQGRRANRYVQTIPFPCIAFEGTERQSAGVKGCATDMFQLIWFVPRGSKRGRVRSMQYAKVPLFVVCVGLRSHFLTDKEISISKRYQPRDVDCPRRCKPLLSC